MYMAIFFCLSKKRSAISRTQACNDIEAGHAAEGKDLTEATMILSHKEAIAMLLEAEQHV